MCTPKFWNDKTICSVKLTEKAQIISTISESRQVKVRGSVPSDESLLS